MDAHPAPAPSRPTAALVAVRMGYGHLRPAHALASATGLPVLEADRAPLASDWERRVWDRSRSLYETASRGTEIPVAGAALRRLLDAVTAIPRPGPRGAQALPNRATRYLRSLVGDGLGAGLVARLRETGAPLLTTFYAPAVVADAAGIESVTCVVTDVEVNRVWAAPDPASSRVRYCVPARRTARRLLAYGVDARRIHVTGFPLPPALLGGPSLATRRRLLADRLLRLDPAGAFRAGADPAAKRLLDDADPAARSVPPRVVFAIGGAGAQRAIATSLVRSLGPALERGTLRLTLVAGTRPDTAEALARFLARTGADRLLGRGLDVLHEPTFSAYAARFDERLATTDVLWTKPSEMVFFGALGLPLVLAPPLGAQERANRAWALRRGAAIDQPEPRAAAAWIEARLRDGALARAAWAGASRMPALGTYRVLEVAGIDPTHADRIDAVPARAV